MSLGAGELHPDCKTQSKTNQIMNRLAKMLGISDAEGGRPMDDTCFATDSEKVFYRCAYETTKGEMALRELGLEWAR